MASDNDEVNPYEPSRVKERPAKRAKKARSDDSMEEDIAAIRIAFEKTRPWITFFKVLSYIGAGAIAIGSIVLLGTANFPPLAALLYFGFALVYVLIGQRLGRYSDSISTVSRSEGRLDAIVSAVEKQQQFWSFVGYLTLITVGLYSVMGVLFLVLWRK